MNANDHAWEKLFRKYDILSAVKARGDYIISANQIREYREPRLMTKFDHRKNLPAIFADNNLAILPISRGDYMISSFLAYYAFDPPSGKAQKFSVSPAIQSLMPRFQVSETVSLNCAKACGILSDFLEDEAIVSTVSGRMSSGCFDFSIDTVQGKKRVNVCNSQIEIDAAYEGVRYLSLFEAKRDLSGDFLVRQLYYPYRVWSGRVAKQIKPVFFISSGGVFYLYEYCFEDPQNYNSLCLVKQKSYRLSTEISMTDIQDMTVNLPVVPEPPVAFPQANSMARIVNLLELLFLHSLSKNEITTRYDFDERQTNYYTDAGRYLGLIQRTRDADDTIRFNLTPCGRRIMGLAYKQRQLAIAAQILSHRVFRETMKVYLRSGYIPHTDEIVRIMKEAHVFQVRSDSTFLRRSSTVSGWIGWILNLVDAYLFAGRTDCRPP